MNNLAGSDSVTDTNGRGMRGMSQLGTVNIQSTYSLRQIGSKKEEAKQKTKIDSFGLGKRIFLAHKL